MVRSFSVIGALSLALFLAGCKNDTESAMSDSVSKTEEMTSVLKGIKDEASAKAAIPKIKSLSADMKAIETKMASAKSSPEDMMKAAQKYAEPMAKATEAFIAEMSRVSQISPEVAQALSGMK